MAQADMVTELSGFVAPMSTAACFPAALVHQDFFAIGRKKNISAISMKYYELQKKNREDHRKQYRINVYQAIAFFVCHGRCQSGRPV
jgi:hypothetical protein